MICCGLVLIDAIHIIQHEFTRTGALWYPENKYNGNNRNDNINTTNQTSWCVYSMGYTKLVLTIKRSRSLGMTNMIFISSPIIHVAIAIHIIIYGLEITSAIYENNINVIMVTLTLLYPGRNTISFASGVKYIFHITFFDQSAIISIVLLMPCFEILVPICLVCILNNVHDFTACNLMDIKSPCTSFRWLSAKLQLLHC